MPQFESSSSLLEIVTLKYNRHVTSWDDFLSSHMGKSYDISREDLLADRTSFMIFDLRILVHVYLMIVVGRTNSLNTILFYVCVFVFLVVLQCIFFHIIFVGSNHLMN